MNKFIVSVFIIYVASALNLGPNFKMPIFGMHLPEACQNNLTCVTWAHAVNNMNFLEECLNGTVMMLEADIVMGKLVNTSIDEDIPIMGHPPANTSDISLEQFLTRVLEFNSKAEAKKGIKLDFKTIEVFEKSLPILRDTFANISEVSFPIWINADIISGPVNASGTPVNPVKFLNGAKEFSNAVLSIGWTTKYGPINNNATYTSSQIQEMLECIVNNEVTQLVTFPVRAGIAANSLEGMKTLIAEVDNSTLTIWSSAGDYVDVDMLRTLIFTIGLNKVYVDVPEDLMNKLNLDVPIS